MEISHSQWRPSQFSKTQKQEIIDEIVQKLKGRYQDGLVAVALEGSTAKGLDKPESDMEFRVVAENLPQPHRWYPFFYRGMFVGISYVTPKVAVEDAKEIDYTWPKTGDSLWTAKILYDPGHFYPRLHELAKEAELRADFNLLAKDSLADMYEHVYKVFTAEDEMTAAFEARSVAMWAANTVGLVNRFRYLSSRKLFSESMALPDLPNRYAVHLAELLSANTNSQKLKEHTGMLWKSFVIWAEEKGISLEDHDLGGL